MTNGRGASGDTAPKVLKAQAPQLGRLQTSSENGDEIDVASSISVGTEGDGPHEVKAGHDARQDPVELPEVTLDRNRHRIGNHLGSLTACDGDPGPAFRGYQDCASRPSLGR